jgi:hypothetical protein
MVQAGTTHGTSVEWSRQLVARGLDNITIRKPTFGDGCSEATKRALETYTEMIVGRVNRARQLVVCVFFK